MRKKIHDANRLAPSGTATHTQNGTDKLRMPRRALNLAMHGRTRVLSEDELRTKRWLDRRIVDITSREQEVDALKKQYQQQLALLSKKEALEQEKKSIKMSALLIKKVLSKSESVQIISPRHVDNADVNTDNGRVEKVVDGFLFHSPISGRERGLSFDEAEALDEVEGRLESVEDQLKLRDQNIASLEAKLSEDDDGVIQDQTLEALKRTSAVSLPAAHELIKLLFELLVNAKSASRSRKVQIMKCLQQEKQLRGEVQESESRLSALGRAHEMALTRVVNDYEDKIQNLFTHSAVGHLVTAQSGLVIESTDAISTNHQYTGHINLTGVPKTPPTASKVTDTQPSTPFSKAFDRYGITNGKESFISSPMNFTSNTLFSPEKSNIHNGETNSDVNSMLNSYKMVAFVHQEQSKLLKSRLESEISRNQILQTRISDVDTTCMQLKRDVDEKDIHIRFLEEERQLFKDIADKLRLGLNTIGGNAGQTILKQVKTPPITSRGGSNSDMVEKPKTIKVKMDLDSDDYGDENDEEDDDPETESVIGQYEQLGSLILQTGNIIPKNPTSTLIGATNSNAGGYYTTTDRQSIVYDRLTNPSNFTGAMKNVFEQDLAEKRQKVKLIKSGQNNKKDKDSNPTFMFLNSKSEINSRFISKLDSYETQDDSVLVQSNQGLSKIGFPLTGRMTKNNVINNISDSLNIPIMNVSSNRSSTNGLKPKLSSRNPISVESKSFLNDVNVPSNNPSLYIEQPRKMESYNTAGDDEEIRGMRRKSVQAQLKTLAIKQRSMLLSSTDDSGLMMKEKNSSNLSGSKAVELRTEKHLFQSNNNNNESSVDHSRISDQNQNHRPFTADSINISDSINTHHHRGLVDESRSDQRSPSMIRNSMSMISPVQNQNVDMNLIHYETLPSLSASIEDEHKRTILTIDVLPSSTRDSLK